MSLDSAIGNFLLGSTDPNSDGLAVSTGIGDGQAQVLKPYSGEAWRQTAQAQMQKEAVQQKNLQQQKELEQEDKQGILKSLEQISGYRPQEFANIEKRQKELIEKTLKLNRGSADYARKLAEIQMGINELKEGVSASKDIAKTYNEANNLIQQGNMYFDQSKVNELASDYNEDYGIIDDTKKWLDILGSKAGRAASLRSDIPLIKDKNVYLKNLIASTSKEYDTGKTYIDPLSGSYRRLTEVRTDPEVLDARIESELATNPQIAKLWGGADNFRRDAKNAAYYGQKEVDKMPTASRSYSGGGGSGAIQIGDATFNPPTVETYNDEKTQRARYNAFISEIDNGLKNAKSDKEKIALRKKAEDYTFEKFAKEHPEDKTETVLSFSIKGNAENNPRLFTVKVGNNLQQVTGTSNKYLPKKDAFRVVDTKGNVYVAPVENNENYITDVMTKSVSEFKKALGSVEKGNVVTTSKKGGESVVKETEEIKIGSNYRGKKVTKIGKTPSGKIVKVMYSDGTTIDVK